MAGRKGKNKQVPARAIPKYGGEKSVSPDALAGVDDKCPVWRTSLMDWDGPFSWNECGTDDMGRVYRELCKLEDCQLKDLRLKGHHPLADAHRRLSGRARNRLEAIGKSHHLDDLFSFKIDYIKRVICLARGMCMYVLWWDPNHNVYPPRRR